MFVTHLPMIHCQKLINFGTIKLLKQVSEQLVSFKIYNPYNLVIKLNLSNWTMLLLDYHLLEKINFFLLFLNSNLKLTLFEHRLSYFHYKIINLAQSQLKSIEFFINQFPFKFHSYLLNNFKLLNNSNVKISNHWTVWNRFFVNYFYLGQRLKRKVCFLNHKIVS